MARFVVREIAVIEIASEAAFNRAVATSERPLLVLFDAPGLGPARVRDTASGAGGEQEIDVLRVDADALPSVARRYGVTALPTLAIINDGQLVARRIGEVNNSDLAQWLEDALT
jgi:thioredoxin-like negative regulator of GroEL